MSNDEPNAGKENLAAIKPNTAPMADARPAAAAPRDRPPETAKPAAPKSEFHLVKWLVIGGIASLLLLGALIIGWPWIYEAWTTESTDDAYVNSYPTFVAPRVSGQVLDDGVKVKDNNRVRIGDLLVQLDPEPYQIQVNLKKAYLKQAKADLLATQDQVRGQIALARSNRFKLQHTIENVNNEIALLRANVATWGATKARQSRAKADYDRAKELSKTPGAISQQDLDLKLQDVRVADSQVKQALETVYQTRVGLGLPAQPVIGDPLTQLLFGVAGGSLSIAAQAEQANDLTQVPPDLDQTFSTVRQGVAELLQSAAPLGVSPSSYNLTPKQILAEFYRRDRPLGSFFLAFGVLPMETLDEFYKRDPQGNVDHIYAQILIDAPAVKQAEAKLLEAQHDLQQAELNLKYCNVYAEIDGVITRRNVNPGNNVQAGQSLMAIRPLKDIWIDANFKETQLRNLRIGQKVRVEVDMYGSHRTFNGRITGFTSGTGQTLSLLPPQNATGNFVKIVQRLPVRIVLNDYDPDKDPPLFVGLSVVPYVYIKQPPIGDDPGKGGLLQPFMPTTPDARETKP